MKMILSGVLVAALLSHLVSQRIALAGGGATGVGGGGDPCEDRIAEIRDDLMGWIRDGGAKRLALPSDVSPERYSASMLAWMEKSEIRCVGPGDPGFPVNIDGTPKVCRFDRALNAGQLTCDFPKFEALSDSDQYVLVHHEFAGLAGIELPQGDQSSYGISNQIVASLTRWSSAPHGERLYVGSVQALLVTDEFAEMASGPDVTVYSDPRAGTRLAIRPGCNGLCVEGFAANGSYLGMWQILGRATSIGVLSVDFKARRLTVSAATGLNDSSQAPRSVVIDFSIADDGFSLTLERDPPYWFVLPFGLTAMTKTEERIVMPFQGGIASREGRFTRIPADDGSTLEVFADRFNDPTAGENYVLLLTETSWPSPFFATRALIPVGFDVKSVSYRSDTGTLYLTGSGSQQMIRLSPDFGTAEARDPDGRPLPVKSILAWKLL